MVRVARSSFMLFLLIGGDKAGKTKRFYRPLISKADRIYDIHLRRITKGESKNVQG